MATSKRSTTTPVPNTENPTTLADFFSPKTNKSVIVNPIADQKAPVVQSVAAPENKSLEAIFNPTLNSNPNLGWQNQTFMEGTKNMGVQFWRGLVSGLGQGIANLTDVSSYGNDTHISSLFGLTTKEMQDWASSAQETNPIYQKNPGKSWQLSDPGWWMNQVASSGTGVGMGIEALLETAGIEMLTGGLGTEVAIARLGNLFNKIRRGAKGTEVLAETLGAARSLRSTATVYGVMNRLNESRMEAMQSYDDIYNELSSIKNEDGTRKFSEEQVKEYASKGSDRTWYGNLALLPLDILSYRTMVFNPISGAGEGLLERGLEKLAGVFGKSIIGKSLGWTLSKGVGIATEGAEEGFQFVASEEGKRYAKVLSGLDKSSTFLSGVNQSVNSDEFWENVAGGIIGAPIIGGAMNTINHVLNGRAKARLNNAHADFVMNSGKMDSRFAAVIRAAEASGNHQKADIYRRQFGVNKAMSALYIDAQANKTTAFESYKAFLEGTLEELEKGNVSSLSDLGYHPDNITEEQVNKIKTDFKDFIKDADDMKSVFDSVKENYHKSVVPEAAQRVFYLNRLLEGKQENSTALETERGKLHQYSHLSSMGKELYEAEYSLTALHAERDRLKEAMRNTSDLFEKEDIQARIKEVESDMTKLDKRVSDIESDELYDSKDRSQDKSIIKSSIKDRNYQQLVYDDIRATSEIHVSRKALMRLNDPSFRKERAKQIIQNATTVQQVQEAAQEADLPAEAVAARVSEIVAEENATDVANENMMSNPVADPVTESSSQSTDGNNHIPGDSSLFDEGFNDLEDMGEDYGYFNEEDHGGGESYTLSPMPIDNKKVTPELKERLKTAVSNMLTQLPGNATFEDLVRATVAQSSKERAEKNFNLLKEGWLLNGKADPDFNKIYNRVFADPIAEFDEIGAAIFSDEKEEQAQTDNDTEVESEIKKENGTPVVTVTGVEYKYDGVVSSNATPKLAVLFRLYDQGQLINDDGSITPTYDYTQDELNEGQYVDGRGLLNPDEFNAGTEMTLAIPANYLDMLVPIYNADGTKGKSMSFRQFVESNNLSSTDQAYRDKIPMIAYRKGKTNEKGLAFVHDIGWYHPRRFDQNKPEDMAKAVEETRRVREAVLTGGYASITITEKKLTSMEPFKTKNNGTKEAPRYEFIPLKEANPEAVLTVASTSSELLDNSKFNNNNNVVIRNTDFRKGRVYDLRRVGITPDGKKTWMALEIAPPMLGPQTRTTIKQALFIYLNKGNKDQAIRKQHDATVKAILNETGLDILNTRDLETYLSQFINFRAFKRANNNTDVDGIVNREIPDTAMTDNPGYIGFAYGGTIYVGARKQNALPPGENQRPVQTVYSNPNSFNKASVDRLMKWLDAKYINTKGKNGTAGAKASIFDTMTLNYSVENSKRNKPVVLIGESGEVRSVAKSYDEFVMSNFRTNIRSVNVAPEGQKPAYASSTVMINYKLTSDFAKTEEVSSKAEIPVEPIQDKSTEDIMKKIEEAAKNALGIDSLDDIDGHILLSPTPLTEAQRVVISNSAMRVDGLTAQENYQLGEFIFNQIIPILDSKGEVSKKEIAEIINKQVRDVIKPFAKSLKDLAQQTRELIKANPSLDTNKLNTLINVYEKEAEKALEAGSSKNLQAMYKIAEDRVRKNLGVKSHEDDQTPEDFNEYQVSNLEEREGWQIETLTLDPNAKTSAALKRFYSGIPVIDENGKPKRGVFGLPLYYSYVEIATMAKNILADTPSDFSKMMEKLQEKKQYTWMPQLISKLEGASQQIKNQFVSDMSMSTLRMRFTMIVEDKNKGTFRTKVWDANKGGIVDTILSNWEQEFNSSKLIKTTTDEDGNLVLDKEYAQVLVNKFKGWTTAGLGTLETSMAAYNSSLKQLKRGEKLYIEPKEGTELFTELNNRLNTTGSRLRFNLNSSTDLQIEKVGNRYAISHLSKVNYTAPETLQEVREWLGEFGITLNDPAFNELVKEGLYHNYRPSSFAAQFEATGGLFKSLSDALEYAIDTQGEFSFTDSGKIPVREGVVKSLASLEYKYNDTITPTGGYVNGKNFYPITQNKFATERASALISETSQVRSQLSRLSFSKNSMWLDMLSSSKKMRELFRVDHVSFSAFQKLGKTSNKDNSLNTLSSLDYEIAIGGAFWDMQQGTFEEYKGFRTRIATMLMPTMSDKQVGLWARVPVLDLTNKDLDSGKGISNQLNHFLYEQAVKPELERMINFYALGGKTNIKGYDEGAGMFLMLPEMNSVEFVSGLTLPQAIKSQALGSKISVETIERNTEIMENIYKIIDSTIRNLVNEKVEVWKRDGIVKTDPNGVITGTKFIDHSYFKNTAKFDGSIEEKVTMAAYDLIVNQMIHLSNSFMLFSGDPALYYKKDSNTNSNDFTQIAKDTFVNFGKRMANQIAPGTKLANSENETYLQIFINDRKSIADKGFIQYITNILDRKRMTDEQYDFVKSYLGKKKSEITFNDSLSMQEIQGNFPNSAGYFAIEGSDAQEYTTWQEHLSILESLGRTPDVMQDISIDEIAQARKIFSSNRSYEDLSEKERAIVSMVMQPIKPVVTGQLFDENQDVMRTMYIKCSSFPLIPQLTAGFEIDKLRQKMEELQSKEKLNVRASYQSANKVGALKNAIDLWDTEGKAITDNISVAKLKESSLVLNRKDFRIQQDVPFKSSKKKEDTISMGTQLMKLLFGNGVIGAKGFNFNGKPLSGKDLYRKFNQLHIDLINNKKQELFDELGIKDLSQAINSTDFIKKVQSILQREAAERGLPQQIIDGLNITEDGEFTTPIWAGLNSNKFEAILNAIIVNRVAKIKFPGNSYVAGSPEGFITAPESSVSSSQVIYTSAWDGESLKAVKDESGKLKRVQVFVGSKFRDRKGNLINLMDDEWSETVGGKRVLKMQKFDTELLNLISFRIPTTGLSSAAAIEIAGFLPYDSADLMILPSNLIKQKGLDFDIDKENTYQYWHVLTNEGRFEKLNDTHRQLLLDDEMDTTGLFGDIAEGSEYADEEISTDAKLRKKNFKVISKIKQNDIIGIYNSVLSNPSKAVQSKINTVLNTDYAEAEALHIENLKPKKDSHWTPLSGEYQKGKTSLGASGKIGTGAYSMDVVFHSMAQQAYSMGRPIKLTVPETIGDPKSPMVPVSWRFGKLENGGVQTDGVLGKMKTLTGNRTTSDLLNETAQIAVDNEKLQIMGKVNLNSTTLDVHKVFNLLGFDNFKTDSKHSIAFLFMSQPILVEYVEALANSKSVLAEYDKNRQEKIVNDLLRKYGSEDETINGVLDPEVESDLMSEENMIGAIGSLFPHETHRELQRAVLKRFLEMERFGLAIRGVQTALNVDSKGLNKSFFDVINKKDKLGSLGNGTFVTSTDGDIIGTIDNVTGLIGEYVPMPHDPSSYSELVSQGYVRIENPSKSPNARDWMVLPTTYTGAFNITTTHLAYNLWKSFMPYDSEILQEIYSETLSVVELSNSNNDAKTIENKQDILAEFKKYLATMRSAGFLDNMDTANSERQRLFIDNDENTSLASYIKGLLEIKGNKIVDRFIKSNKLFNNFEFSISKVGEPSLIKYNNTKGEAWDEVLLYEAMSNMFEVFGQNNTIELPQIGNKKYTLDTLAQDLISYSMLANAKQEAIQFTKYIPASYLEMVGYSYLTRTIHNILNGSASENAIHNLRNKLGLIPKTEETSHVLSEFSTQFIQHNPGMVKAELSLKEMSKILIPVKGTNNTFIFNGDRKKPTFIKVYDPKVKGRNKFRLYKFNGETYNRIPLLGTFGMDEYQFGGSIGKSIIHQDFITLAPVRSTNNTSKAVEENLYDVSKGSLTTTVNLIAKDKANPFSKLAEILIPYISDRKIEISDTLPDGRRDFYGAWDPETRVITINPARLQNSVLFAQTLLHEAVHDITFLKITPYINEDSKGVVHITDLSAPDYVSNFVQLYNEVRSKSDLEGLMNYFKNSRQATQEDISKYYGFTSFSEFFTMAMTDPDFQSVLNTIPYSKGEMSLLERFKQLIKTVLEALGANFDEKYSAAHAINSIFDVIKAQEKQQQEDDMYGYSETDEDFNNFNDTWDESDGGDTEITLSVAPTSYPNITFEIPNTECK